MTTVTSDVFFNQKIFVEKGEYTRAELMFRAATYAEAPDGPVVDDIDPVDDGQAPRGWPGIGHAMDVLEWIKADSRRTDAFIGGLKANPGTTSESLKANISGAREAISHMPVFDSARWLFSVIDSEKAVSTRALVDAFDGRELSFRKEMTDFGFTDDGVVENSKAWDYAQRHSFMPAIIAGAREDGAYRSECKLSAAAVIKTLKTAYDIMPPSAHPKMADHVRKHWVTSTDKAMSPVVKALQMSTSITGDTASEWIEAVTALAAGMYISSEDMALVFAGDWSALYEKLTRCLDTIGPRPPWIKYGQV